MDASSVVDDAAWLIKAWEIATLTCLPMAVRAALLLKVPDILARHAPEPQPFLSPSQIASHFEPPLASSTSLERASASLDRILCVLACHGLLSSSLLWGDQGIPIRAYGLNSSSQFLLQTAAQTSLAPFVLFHMDPLILQPLFHLHEAVLDGSCSLEKAHGTTAWSFLQSQPRLDALFNQAMVNNSYPLISALLDRYVHCFADVTTLVDVGGGHGSCLHMITSKHPHSKGINFDQPHVVAEAPSYPGVEHVGGDMFQEVPKASAIFMKDILHSWSDACCSKILKNCYRALPETGKLIVALVIPPTQVDCEPSSRFSYHMDLIMFAFIQEGKERTYEELENLCKACGFSRVRMICTLYAHSVVEIFKEPSTI